MLTKFGIALRKPRRPKTRFTVLKEADNGYKFEQGAIHWPNTVEQNGETWQIEYE